ncbi:Type I phosphodiesterase / nucleotide pyrophosphatase [uncultured archaeon]|nr:Type I phosphodiesterase / nucleotide pyrophosphatase [uncultured archaeon]
MEKVFVFGIDGAMPEKIFGEWLDELPNIKKLMSGGSYAKLNSTIPPLSGTAWTSITTGKSPTDTGLFEYIYRKKNSYTEFGLVSSQNIKEKYIWDIAAEKKINPISCFVPITWPVKPYNGILISGFMTPNNPETEYSYPREIKKEINNLLGEHMLIDVPNFRDLTKEDIIKQVYRVSDMHVNTMKYLLKNKKWNFFIGVLNGSDRINHSFWKYQDKFHRKYEKNSKFESVLKEYYKYVDKRLGELLEIVGDATVIILSDHGITRMHNRVNLSDWLIQQGYMFLKEPLTEKKELKMDMVDWSKTKVFALGAYDGEIFVNLKGREPEGIVKEGEYDSLINELEKKLKEITGDDKSKLDTQIFTKKRNLNGKCRDIAPDMIVFFDNLQYGCNTTMVGNETLWSLSTAKGSDDAGHSRQGIFIINKTKQKGDIGEIDILDVAPTILDRLGVSIPKDFNGKVIE